MKTIIILYGRKKTNDNGNMKERRYIWKIIINEDINDIINNWMILKYEY